MKNLMQQIGKEKFLAMLKKSSEMIQMNDKDANINYNERTLSAMSNLVKKQYASIPQLTFEMISDNDDMLEFKYTECLWSKTFREADAIEIGYAGVCYQDYPLIKAFNPNLKLIRDKTLMQGHDCCHFKIVKEI